MVYVAIAVPTVPECVVALLITGTGGLLLMVMSTVRMLVLRLPGPLRA